MLPTPTPRSSAELRWSRRTRLGIIAALLTTTSLAVVEPAEAAGTPPNCSISFVRVVRGNAHSIEVDLENCQPRDELENAPTGIRVEVSGRGGSATKIIPLEPDHAIDERVTFDGLEAAHLVRVTATPFNDAGDSTAPPTMTGTVLPFRTPADFLARIGLDFADSSDDYSPEGPNLILNGGWQPEELVRQGRGYIPGFYMQPIARLYRAYFLRDPDVAGLKYWTLKRRFGVWLHEVSSNFAASSEFKRRYGSLDDRAFVAKLYKNVFGRTADAEGLDFWTHRLESRKATRGQVVQTFSESNEFRNKTEPALGPLVNSVAMLRRKPTVAEAAAWAALPNPDEDSAVAIMQTDAYSATVNPS